MMDLYSNDLESMRMRLTSLCSVEVPLRPDAVTLKVCAGPPSIHSFDNLLNREGKTGTPFPEDSSSRNVSRGVAFPCELHSPHPCRIYVPVHVLRTCLYVLISGHPIILQEALPVC